METRKEAWQGRRGRYVDRAARDLSPPFASIKMANEMRKLRMADILWELNRAASRN
jgi:hypothetical protein